MTINNLMQKLRAEYPDNTTFTESDVIEYLTKVFDLSYIPDENIEQFVDDYISFSQADYIKFDDFDCYGSRIAGYDSINLADDFEYFVINDAAKEVYSVETIDIAYQAERDRDFIKWYIMEYIIPDTDMDQINKN